MDRAALNTAFSWPYTKRALIVAAVVGTVLNLINQGYTFFGPVDFRWPNALLTYCVPFFVSTYGAYVGLSADMGTDGAEPAESHTQ